MLQKKSALVESSQSHLAPILSSTEQDMEHTQTAAGDDVIDDDDEFPSVDESITPRQQNDDCGPSSEYLLLSALCQCAPMMLARRLTSCLRIGVRLGREAREETDRDPPRGLRSSLMSGG